MVQLNIVDVKCGDTRFECEARIGQLGSQRLDTGMGAPTGQSFRMAHVQLHLIHSAPIWRG
jgi:hypothetical protein